MLFERFLKEGSRMGLIGGAPDIVILSVNPMLMFLATKYVWIFYFLGLAAAVVNTRAILPFVLMSLLFLEERGKPSVLIFAIGLLFLLANAMVFWMAFHVEGGIQ